MECTPSTWSEVEVDGACVLPWDEVSSTSEEGFSSTAKTFSCWFEEDSSSFTSVIVVLTEGS